MSSPPSPEAFALREEIDTALAQRVNYGEWPDALRAAHQRHQREHVHLALRFQIVVGLVISAGALVFDALVLPHKFDLALGWRLTTNLPLALAGLFLFGAVQLRWIKLTTGLSLISFAMLAIHLASFADPEIMARYAMATTFLLGICCFALPFTPRELARFALTFGLATSLIALWPNPLPPLEIALHMSFMALVGLPCWAIARRHWELNTRAFLLDLRDDLTREELEQNNKLLRRLSEQDPLTGMPNRRHFERVISEGLAGPERRPTGKIALMMIDLDHFKEFNDRHGHQAGDRCLTMAGVQLREAFGSRRGIVARYGGEEFVAALQERVAGEAASLAEHMRLTIARMLVPVRDDSKPLITTSIGVALAPADTTLELEDLIEMADVALYSAKRAGRNRVEIIEAGEETSRLSSGEDNRRRA